MEPPIDPELARRMEIARDAERGRRAAEEAVVAAGRTDPLDAGQLEPLRRNLDQVWREEREADMAVLDRRLELEPDTELKKRQRSAVLRALYELGGGNPLQPVEVRRVRERSGVPEGDMYATLNWLADRGQLMFEPGGSEVRITQDGADDAEDNKPTEGRPTGAILLSPEVRAEIEGWLRKVNVADQEGDLDKLDHDDRSELDAERQTIVAQSRSPRPKAGIVRAALGRAGEILSQSMAAFLGAEAVNLVSRIHL